MNETLLMRKPAVVLFIIQEMPYIWKMKKKKKNRKIQTQDQSRYRQKACLIVLINLQL